MSYVPINTGAMSTGYNVALTPAMPPGFVAGNLLLLTAGIQAGSFTPPAVAGWTRLSPAVNAKQCGLWGKIAVGSDASPSINYGNAFSYACVTAYSGNPSSLTGIVHASADRDATATDQIPFPALTITQPGCLVIAAGQRDKAAATNGATAEIYGSFAVRNQVTIAGTAVQGVVNDWIQAAALSISLGSQNISISGDGNVNCQGYIVALLPKIVVVPVLQKLPLLGVG